MPAGCRDGVGIPRSVRTADELDAVGLPSDGPGGEFAARRCRRHEPIRSSRSPTLGAMVCGASTRRLLRLRRRAMIRGACGVRQGRSVFPRPRAGRLAQRESDSLTRSRSEVRSLQRPREGPGMPCGSRAPFQPPDPHGIRARPVRRLPVLPTPGAGAPRAPSIAGCGPIALPLRYPSPSMTLARSGDLHRSYPHLVA